MPVPAPRRSAKLSTGSTRSPSAPVKAVEQPVPPEDRVNTASGKIAPARITSYDIPDRIDDCNFHPSAKGQTCGWDSLTRAELRVVVLVAEGLTNTRIAQRLYLSRYTVETHLKHVFVKLHVTSRAALAAEAARRGVSR
jgi:DNA-binding CsgD family transcriptional regulator